MSIEKKCMMTDREAEFLFFLSQSFTGKEIATHMDLSVRTIEYYMRRVKEKTNLYRRSQLVNFFKNSIEKDKCY